MASYLLSVGYDNSKYGLPAVTCSIARRSPRGVVYGHELSICYTGKEADELLKILTQQGYLTELLNKKGE